MCVDLLVFIRVYFMCFVSHYMHVVLYYCQHGGVGLMGLKPGPYDPSSFSALTLLAGSFDLQKPIPDMTYTVFGGTFI